VDKAFWQSIKGNAYTAQQGYTTANLTAELLACLSSPDPEMREELAYPILDTWIHSGAYSHQELWDIATRLLNNLTQGLGEQRRDGIFGRSFSLLILTEIIYHDLTQPTLSASEVQQVLGQALSYVEAEQDLRGYDVQKGWIHAIAHAADLLWVIAQHPTVTAPDLARIMDTVAKKIAAPVEQVYLYDEEERLVRTIMGVLQRDVLTLPFLSAWLELRIHPEGRTGWNESFEGPESGKMMEVVRSHTETCARHNVKSFLRSLYFQLRSPGFANLTFVEQQPPITAEFLPLVEHALSQIRLWC